MQGHGRGGAGVGLTRLCVVSHTLGLTVNRADSPLASARRLWTYRLLAFIGIPLALLVAFEAGLRVIGYGRPASFLIPDDQPGWYRTNPEYLNLFMPEGFNLRPLNFRLSVRKPAGTVRIVVLGESAAEGVPAPEFGFVPQLRAQLRARYPGKSIEVLNTGIAAINSHVIFQIARDLADYSPDLFVIYAGNNEVVGPYGPGCTYLSEMPPLWVIRLSVFVRSTRTGQLLNRAIVKLAKHGEPAKWGGMAMFADSAVAGNDPRLEKVYRNFEDNLHDILRVASASGAKTVMCTAVANLKDCPPLLPRHRADLSGAELREWDRFFRRGTIEWRLGENAAARSDLEAAYRIDPQYADTPYMLGTLALQAGETEKARARFVEALHWDALRFRPDPRINEAIRRVATGAGSSVRLLDEAKQLGSDPASSSAPAGREILFEHVHFNWEGNYRMARALAAESASLLFGDEVGTREWLDSGGVAAALAYSPYEQEMVIERLLGLVDGPPFTNQLTYVEDQTRLAQALVRIQPVVRTPDSLSRARAMAHAAALQDPENPFLAKIEADLASELSDWDAALAAIRHAMQLQPRNLAARLDEVTALAHAQRQKEAEALLDEIAADSPSREHQGLEPAYADFYLRTGRIDEARRRLDAAIKKYPDARDLAWWRARLEQIAGNAAEAERRYRAILTDDPTDKEALEFLGILLAKDGRTDELNQLSLTLADRQPRNQANSRRAALLAEQKGDKPATIRYLLAAEHCGPVTSAFEMHLARLLFELGRREDALDHLGVAKRLTQFESDPAGAEAIAKIVARVREKSPGTK